MRKLLPLLLLAGCSPAHPPADPKVAAVLPEHCPTHAVAPQPPAKGRTIEQLTAYAQAAGVAANQAIKERDECAKLFLSLRATAIPPKVRD